MEFVKVNDTILQLKIAILMILLKNWWDVCDTNIFFKCFSYSIDECDLLKWSNSCSKGLFRATQGGWSKTITMTSGGFDISDWCFCHVKPYDKSNSYFKVIYNKFEVIF